MKNLSEIIDLIEEIVSSDYDKNFSLIKKLRKKTRAIWSIHHAELLKELNRPGKSIGGIDYSMLWYECLGYPHNTPLFRDMQGHTIGSFGDLPSDFNRVSHYHDANINYTTFNNGNLSLNLALFGEWGVVDESVYDMKAIFRDVISMHLGRNKQYSKVDYDVVAEKLRGTAVVYMCEKPPINWVLNKFSIIETEEIVDNRLFYVSLSNYEDRSLDGLVICCRNWSQEGPLNQL